MSDQRGLVTLGTGWGWPGASRFFLAAALALWLARVATALATQVWTTEQGAQGPIILATGLWLLAVRTGSAAPATPGRLDVAAGCLLPCLVLYVVASMVNMLSAMLFATWAVLVVLVYAERGARVLRRAWLPLGYLLFVIPPPAFVIDPVVQILKQGIAAKAVAIAAAMGAEVAVRGSSLFVDQYELVVAAACSGMNSIVSLFALGLFYVYVRHDGDWRYATLLALAVVPAALAANLVRVVLLLFEVRRWGARVLDTPLHMVTGLVMAAVAMALLVAIDVALAPLARLARASRRG